MKTVQSVLVALGWFAAAFAAVVVGLSGVPATPDQNCSLVFSCMTPAEEATFFLLFYGAPVVLGLIVVTTAVTALIGRHVRSPILIGTASASCCLVVVAVVVAVWHGGR